MCEQWVRKKVISVFDAFWLKLIGERWITHEGDAVDYWRTEGADSVIVLPVYRDNFVLPSPIFRPGVGHCTLDFPGGRCAKSKDPKAVALETLEREVGVDSRDVEGLYPLNRSPWNVNSSTSDQRLFGFTAQISTDTEFQDARVSMFEIEAGGVQALLDKLDCLQCRALLLEFLQLRQSG